MDGVPRDGSFDFVLSNPPYVGFHEADKVQDVVKKFEPKMAVFAGECGLDVIRRLIPQAYDALRPGGYLVFEIGYTMAPTATELLAGWMDVHAVADLSGIPQGDGGPASVGVSNEALHLSGGFMFKAIYLTKENNNLFARLTDLDESQLSADGDVLAKVEYSTINYRTGWLSPTRPRWSGNGRWCPE